MPFAPLSFLRGPFPPRTITKHQNPTLLHDTLGRSFHLEFYRHPDIGGKGAFFNKQAYPPHNSQLDSELTLYYPPAHYHLLSDEHFIVSAGAGTWYLWDRSVHLSKGDEIVIPARTWHRFEGDASLDQPLTIDVKYDKAYAAMEERFFRNTLSYIGDCSKAGVTPSVFQLMVFFVHNMMPPGIRTPGPEFLNLLLNTAFMFVVGGVGEFLLGYQASYPEYYDESEKSM
jgi:mannose-6-phosphate isomerase-like protein (cupin superfamily)